MKRQPDTLTADLFSIPQPAAPIASSMDYRKQISHVVSAMLDDAAAAGIDRYEVSSRASRLTGRDISKAMLDGYTAESRTGFNVPFWLTPVLEVVCCSTRLTNWLCANRGGRFIVGAQTIDAEIGRLEHERELATERLAQLRKQRRSAR